MATIVNTPAQDSSGNGMGFFLGVLLLIVVGFFVVYYGIPSMRNTSPTPQINVPDKVDVNVNQKK